MYTVKFQFHSESGTAIHHEEKFYCFEDAYMFFSRLKRFTSNEGYEIEYAYLIREYTSILEFQHIFSEELPFN